MKKTETNNLTIEGNSKEQMTHLFDDYYMDADSYQCFLKKAVLRKKKNSGETYESMQTIGSYPNPVAVLKACLKNETRIGISEGRFKELKDVISFMNELTNRIESLAIE